MNVNQEIGHSEHVYDIVADSKNEREDMYNNLYAINREL
jgi:hypothetical protein